MRVVEDLSPEALKFVETALGLSFPGGTTGITSLTDSGRIAGVVVFTPLCKGNSNMHVASAGGFWLTPEFCRKIFLYGFDTLKATRLTATVQVSNTRSVRLVTRVGFVLEGCMRGFNFGDLLIFGMRKGECKWVE